MFEPSEEAPPHQKVQPAYAEPMASIAEESTELAASASTRSMESSDPNPFDKVTDPDGLNGNMAIAHEASHIKLRSQYSAKQPREKTAESCDNFELDMKAAAFGACVCGHLKNEHKSKLSNNEPASVFHTAGARSNSVSTRPAQLPQASNSTSSQLNNATSPKGNASFAARGNQYPALEPCDSYQVDVSASTFGACVCGHTKANHKSTHGSSPSSSFREIPKLKSRTNDGANDEDDHPPETNNAAKRPSGDASSGSFAALRKPSDLAASATTIAGSFRRSSDTPAVPAPSAVSAAPGSGMIAKPPPPPRRPNETAMRPALTKSNSSLASSTDDLVPTGPKVYGGEDAPAAESSKPVEEKNHRDRLVAFYNKYNPDKLSEIDTILEKFKGKEASLFKKLKNKYPDSADM